MTLWLVVLVASLLCYALKLAGYLLPQELLEKPTPLRIANLLTVALLAALIVVQTLGAGESIQVDARVPALAVSALLFWARVPFVLVVLAAAVVAASIRALGWG